MKDAGFMESNGKVGKPGDSRFFGSILFCLHEFAERLGLLIEAYVIAVFDKSQRILNFEICHGSRSLETAFEQSESMKVGAFSFAATEEIDKFPKKIEMLETFHSHLYTTDFHAPYRVPSFIDFLTRRFKIFREP